MLNCQIVVGAFIGGEYRKLFQLVLGMQRVDMALNEICFLFQIIWKNTTLDDLLILLFSEYTFEQKKAHHLGYCVN